MTMTGTTWYGSDLRHFPGTAASAVAIVASGASAVVAAAAPAAAFGYAAAGQNRDCYCLQRRQPSDPQERAGTGTPQPVVGKFWDPGARDVIIAHDALG